MKTIRYFAVALAGLLLVACDQNAPEDFGFYNLNADSEWEVLINYAANTLLSIRLAEIAAENAGSEQVRGLASSIAKDQRELYAELQKLAADMEMRLPQMFMQRQVDVLRMMRSKEGTSMDKALVKMIDHYDRAFGAQMVNIMQEKATHQGVVEFCRLVDEQRSIHQEKARMLKSRTNV